MLTFPYSTHSLVKDIVNEFPKSSDIFKKYRIDFCCGGNIPLSDAIAANGINEKALMNDLKALYEKSSSAKTSVDVWTQSDSNTIIDHVINHYHRTSKEELSMLSPYVTKVSRVHGDSHPELLKVYELFYAFKKELTEHMEKEESIVFPLIKNLADGTVKNREDAIQLIVELEKEHDHAGDLLRKLREITSDFTPPVDACGTYRLVYKRLEELEGLTFMHVHLENNILFPRYF